MTGDERESPSIRLFLVRHAETLANGRKVLRGKASGPDPISEEGWRQAAACGAELAARGPTDPRVYASTYLRAQETAGAVARALGVEVSVLEGLHEMDIGDWFGRPYGDLETCGHELLRPGGRFGFPGGEDDLAVARRTRGALSEALARGGTPVLVSHGLALSILLCDLLGTDFLEAWRDGRHNHRNTGISELRQRDGRWEGVQIAFAGHLDAVTS